MESKQFDTLGRATFHNAEFNPSITYNERSLRWFELLNLHGQLNSEYLHQFTKHLYKDPGKAREALRRMVEGGYITKPGQQRSNIRATSSFYIYQLTERGKDALMQENRYVETIQPSGQWAHQYMTSCVTASIHLAAQHAGFEFIPGHVILEKGETTLAANIDGKRLIPDQLFAIDYGEGTRFFCVEVDRGTEPGTSRANRKSYEKSIEDYMKFIEGGLYKKHYGITSQMKVLYVFRSRGDEMRFHQVCQQKFGKCHHILTQTIDGFFPVVQPDKPHSHLFTEPWNRAGMTEFSINRA